MKESYLYTKQGDIIECQTCHHFCHIAPFKRGICGLRENNKGKLLVLNYGRLIAQEIDQIEKKPFFHFLPKTKTFSIASVGCNFHCAWCQNWDISQCSKEESSRDEVMNELGFETTPEQVVQDAIRFNCPSISYTYTEPTVFLEFALDTMKLAHKENLKNIWVSNGYMSDQTLDLILPYLDAINVDLKLFDQNKLTKYTGAKLEPILKNLKKIYNNKTHLEITTLVISDINDSEEQLKEIAEFIVSISPDIPWHISRFFPAYKMLGQPITPIETLELAQSIGKKAGLRYTHVGNI